MLIFWFFYHKFQVGEPFICKNDKKIIFVILHRTAEEVNYTKNG
jgi:hypothetical protein